MDIVTLVAVGALVVERILVHTITAIRRCKSRCACSSCDLSKDNDHEETASPSRVEIPKDL
jgi:ferredoxin